ncbi:MAG: diaminopimelate epimerase [Solirubrobacteraceae bacterium]
MIFYKYQGTGNDFILIDDRGKKFPKENNFLIKELCNRHFGIGADGLILLEKDEESDFKMVYFNSDGNESTLCGNGGRCIVAFARDLELIKNETLFNAIDGLHKAKITEDLVYLKMNDVSEIKNSATYYFLNTGSPHHVEFVENIDELDVKTLGSKIRYGAPYFKEGSNVNFVEKVNEQQLKIRTYERGVEDETLSCGTGITASALAYHYSKQTNLTKIEIKTPGGNLTVSFDCVNGKYQNIYLIGPAKLVFTGNIKL